MLARNIELNGVEATVIPAAVDAFDGTVIMELGPLDYGHRVLYRPVAASSSVLEVNAISIPTILRRLGWDRVGLLKVDIEGHERKLLSKSCEWLNLVDALCIECHEGFGEENLLRIARTCGFQRPENFGGIWLLQRS